MTTLDFDTIRSTVERQRLVATIAQMLAQNAALEGQVAALTHEVQLLRADVARRANGHAGDDAEPAAPAA